MRYYSSRPVIMGLAALINVAACGISISAEESSNRIDAEFIDQSAKFASGKWVRHEGQIYICRSGDFKIYRYTGNVRCGGRKAKNLQEDLAALKGSIANIHIKKQDIDVDGSLEVSYTIEKIDAAVSDSSLTETITVAANSWRWVHGETGSVIEVCADYYSIGLSGKVRCRGRDRYGANTLTLQEAVDRAAGGAGVILGKPLVSRPIPNLVDVRGRPAPYTQTLTVEYRILTRDESQPKQPRPNFATMFDTIGDIQTKLPNTIANFFESSIPWQVLTLMFLMLIYAFLRFTHSLHKRRVDSLDDATGNDRVVIKGRRSKTDI